MAMPVKASQATTDWRAMNPGYVAEPPRDSKDGRIVHIDGGRYADACREIEAFRAAGGTKEGTKK